MASLADIWDAPAETVSSDPKPPVYSVDDDDDDVPATNPKRSTVRPRSTLFLDSDSENDAPTGTSGTARYVKGPGSSKPDIDAFWDDLDAEPETTFKELAPSLDVEALKRQADAKIALTPHQILPSSSPPRDLDDDGGKGADGKKGKDGGTTRKKKRPVLDEGRLVGRDGFPALIKQTKTFKPKGKGHELSDLNRLLNVYQFWSHQMYPNTQFSDTVQRIEKLCHSKRLGVALGVWRDEAKGLINGHKVVDGEAVSGSDNDDDNEDAGRPSDVPVATEDERSSPAPSRGPSLPPSSASEGDALDDDFDIDAMIREEETAVRAGPSSGTSTAPRASTSSRASGDEDEAMWDAMMDDIPVEPFMPPDRRPASSKQARPADEDEDEEMWDIVREMEMDAETSGKATGPSGSAAGPSSVEPITGPSGLAGVDPTRPATNDDGWDEMYA